MPSLKTCVKCGLPETYETIEFEASGVCNICSQKVFKDTKIDWAARQQIMQSLVAEYRGKYDYDCIVPFSGGKDSTFTLWYIVRELKLKPLVVQFNHGFLRPTVLENNQRTLKALGVDFLSFTPNWHVVKRVMKEALIRKGDFCWHCHTGIFSYPMHVAINFNVPLLFWGEPSSEYTAYFDYRDDEIHEMDETAFNRFVNLGITAEDMAGMMRSDTALDPRDMKPYTYPSVRDLKRIKCRSMYLGSFVPWDVRRNTEIIQRELGWKGDEVEGVPFAQYPYEKIECYMQGVRDYIKFLKRGYSRVTQMTALDLRNERITKGEAEALIQEFEGKKPASLELFLDYMEMTEPEFNDIVLKTVVAPHVPDFTQLQRSPRTWDFTTWYREK